jgi:DNA polymerase-3 subunit delta'
MGFADIIGHEKQLELLRRALANARLHHAYLFVGPEGVGKRTVALSVAKAVHCGESRNDFCGGCANCARILDGNHADVRLIQPLPGKKEIGIQQIRQMEKELNYRSFSGPRKIMIIDSAALLNVPAQNALLKTLEEPPQDSLLILIAPNGGVLLPTVRSRCLSIFFGPLPGDLIARHLVVVHGCAPEDARVLAAMAMGSLGGAMNLRNETVPEMRRRWIESVGPLKRGDYRGAINAAEALSANREESLKFLEWLQSWYRDLLVHGVTGGTQELINLDMAREIERRATIRPLEEIAELMGVAAGTAARIQRNLNRRMILENLLLKTVEER